MRWGRENHGHIDQKNLAAVGRLAIETFRMIDSNISFDRIQHNVTVRFC